MPFSDSQMTDIKLPIFLLVLLGVEKIMKRSSRLSTLVECIPPRLTHSWACLSSGKDVLIIYPKYVSVRSMYLKRLNHSSICSDLFKLKQYH